MTRRMFAIGAVIAVAIGTTIPVASASSAPIVGAQVGAARVQIKPEMVSVRPNGSPSTKDSFEPAISDDGRWVTYVSRVRRLVDGMVLPPQTYQVVLRDMDLGVTHLVSENADGQAGDQDSRFPSVSADGRYVAFTSEADNLIGQATTGWHLYVRDMQTGEVVLLDRTPAGAPSNGSKTQISISGDGSLVAFTTDSTDLIPGDDGDAFDVAAIEVATGEVTLVSGNASGHAVGGAHASVSGDGARVAFASASDQLVAGDLNDDADVFVRDMASGTFTLVSQSASGGSADDDSTSASISADGNSVVFISSANDLIAGFPSGASEYQVFVRDLDTATTELITVNWHGDPGDSGAYERPGVSADGSRVVFTTQARDLLRHPTSGYTPDTFVRDRAQGKTYLVDQRNGVIGDHGSAECAISADGSTVEFLSASENLVRRDGNRRDDVFYVQF